MNCPAVNASSYYWSCLPRKSDVNEASRIVSDCSALLNEKKCVVFNGSEESAAIVCKSLLHDML